MSNFSNDDPKQDGLKDAFENIRADGESSEELFFDPATGELRSAAATTTRTASPPPRWRGKASSCGKATARWPSTRCAANRRPTAHPRP